MTSNSTDGEVRPTAPEVDGGRHRRRRDERGRTSPSLLQPRRQSSTQKAPGALGSRFGGESPVSFREEIESQTEAKNPLTSWKKTRSIPRGTGSSEDDHDGIRAGGGLGGYETVEADVVEEAPLVREEVADYVGSIDFRDGTGASALPPNEVARVFRDAEDFALLGRGVEFWSHLTGDDRGRNRHHHSVGAGYGKAVVGEIGRAGRGVSGVNWRRRRVVHVESATTGKFFKVYEGLEGPRGSGGTWTMLHRHPDGEDCTRDDGRQVEMHGGRGASSPGGAGGGGHAEDEVGAAERLGISVREVSMMRLNKAVETGTLFVQGVLAGLTLSSMYTIVLAESLESFVAAYEAQAGELRRAMFVLCTLALTGTEDQLMQAKGKRDVWENLGWRERVELWVCVLLYGGCLVSSLVCSGADTGIANAYGSITEGWYVGRMEDGDLRSTILLWYACNLARFVLAWTGWFLACRRRWRVSLLSDQSQIELKDQRDKLSASKEQISRLNGRGLDPLTKKELQELRCSLKRALDNVERVIGLR